ncbi:MAG: hypothetical protein DLM73_09670 [Chthoniobacterales bacterium]|nr:MAG: hypothetical protein DLM73_09670 [Chthoniobacterales bacterium]
MTTVPSEKTNGAGVGAIVAAGVGVAVLGLSVILAEMSAATMKGLNWWPPAGPLVGKSSMGLIAWLVAWAALHAAWRRREVSFRMWWAVTLVLILIGVLLTFPPIFQLPRAGG